MKEIKKNIDIEELFSQKLENAEVVPDVSVREKLMQKTAVRTFLRFNPSRFNVYYLGGIIAAGITTALILFSLSGKWHELPDKSFPNGSRDTIDIIDAITLARQTDTNVPGTSVNNPAGSKESAKNALPKTTSSINETTQKKLSPENDSIASYSTINYPYKRKGLFPKSLTDNTVLQLRYKTDKLIFKSSVKEGCAPLKVLFHNDIEDFDSCRWTFGDGGSSGKSDIEWVYNAEGEYKVVLEVFGKDGLKSTSSEVITVFPKPLARFEILPEKAVIPDAEIRFVNYSVDAIKYKWNFGDGVTSEIFEPVHKYEKFGSFNVGLEVTSEHGCSDTLIVLDAFSDSEYFINFPNAFIPNTSGPTGGFYSSKSDETGDVFHPSFTGVTEYHLKIFSKLGLLVFESNDVNMGWDGYFNGQICKPGVYIWKVSGNFRNGETFNRLGDVTLLRK